MPCHVYHPPATIFCLVVWWHHSQENGWFMTLAEVNFQLFDAASLKKPVQGHFGELDAMAGFSDAATGKRLEADLRAAGNSDVEVFIYPKVGHAFMNDKPSPFPTFAARMLQCRHGHATACRGGPVHWHESLQGLFHRRCQQRTETNFTCPFSS